jgi:hypothetical protein
MGKDKEKGLILLYIISIAVPSNLPVSFSKK